MANLEFCDTHNIVAYLKKPEGSEGFHQIVDFLNASHIRYALTENPTIYVSLINQFWKTTTTRTLDDEEIELAATIDGKVKIVTEVSVRRHLQLADSDGISSLPTTKIFEQLSLMGSPTQALVADETASTGVDVRYRGATTTFTGLEAGQGSVESLETDLKQTKQIYGAAFTKLIKKVKKLEKTVKSSQARRRTRIVVFDDEDALEDPSKQEMKIDKIDQDPDISLEVSTADLDVSTAELVSTAGAAVTTTSVAVSTARPIVSTADEITMAETLQEQERLSYEAAVRLQAELEEEERQRIAMVHEAASSFNVEEWDDIQARIEADEELTLKFQVEEKEKYTEAEQARMLVNLINQRKRYFAAQRAEERRNKPPTQAQQRTYMSNYIKHMGSYTLQQLRGYSFDEIKSLFEITMKRVNTFVLMESEDDRAVPELAAESSKRVAEEELDQESSKKQKTGESSELAEEPRDKETDELSQEELQQMMIIVPEKYWKIIRVGNHTEVYHFFDDMLKSFDKDDLVLLWSLVKEKFNSTEPIDDKEREIWVELKRLFEPDTDDELWKLQKLIHDLTWKLCDSCGVHHVSTEEGIDIYMLVEKEYPLSRGTLTLMMEAKLLVEQDNEMSRELLRKIFVQVERPRK
ncbi:hypothetical protein Tco_0954356 [Tanacetum coccineum]|uniref:Xylulose kinase-1 n=1 Tax=Tanacetum coccineum TaxID=301880 RepID=A0ABQ5E2J7_9ASTR